MERLKAGVTAYAGYRSGGVPAPLFFREKRSLLRRSSVDGLRRPLRTDSKNAFPG
jgi:hypothetical protein